MISVRGLSCRYRDQSEYVLRNLSFECPSDGFTAVVGMSGVGKSTLIALLAGMYVATDSLFEDLNGQILIDGRAPRDLRGPSITSWVPQTPSLLDHLTVVENIVLPLTLIQRIAPSQASDQDRCEAYRLLRGAGLESWADRRPRELSGGMCTRVALLRALVSKPKYLFLDEPFASLDLVNRWGIYRLLQAERDATACTTILTTHDIPEAALIADRILMLENTAENTGLSVISNQSVRIGEFLDGVSLRSAREEASSIESRLFQDCVGKTEGSSTRGKIRCA